MLFRSVPRNFHFASRLRTNIPPLLSPLAIFLASIPRPKGRACLAGPPPRPKSHDLPHFEAISRTLFRQLPSNVQIGFAWLPRLSGWQRQSLHAPQHASEQAPRQMALCQHLPASGLAFPTRRRLDKPLFQARDRLQCIERKTPSELARKTALLKAFPMRCEASGYHKLHLDSGPPLPIYTM